MSALAAPMTSRTRSVPTCRKVSGVTELSRCLLSEMIRVSDRIRFEFPGLHNPGLLKQHEAFGAGGANGLLRSTNEIRVLVHAENFTVC